MTVANRCLSVSTITFSLTTILILTIGLCSLSGCSSLTRVFFYPKESYIRTPADIGLNYEAVTITTEDGIELACWWLPSQQAPETAPTVLFLHGNAENISSHIASVYWLPPEGINVLLLDYRGYGHSQGKAEFPGVFNDVKAAFEWLKQRPLQGKTIVLGQSLGSAIATTSTAMFQAQYPIDGLVLDASFTSFQTIARDMTSRSFLSWVLWPATWLLPTSWDPEQHIQHIAPTPILFFHSQTDEVIPYQRGQQLYQRASQPKYWLNSMGSHIQTLQFPPLRQALVNFIHHGDPNFSEIPHE